MENNIELKGYGYESDSGFETKRVLFTLKIVAKKIDNKKYGENRLYKLLRDEGLFDENNHAYQEFVDNGFFENQQTRRRFQDIHAYTNQVLVTPKGLDLIKRIIENEENKF